MTKHTPGPWRVASYFKTNGLDVPWYQVKNENGFIVAECGQGRFEMLNNAHLIAAAPELLEALEEAHLDLLNSDDSYAGSSVCRRNQDLIDRAKGDV